MLDDIYLTVTILVFIFIWIPIFGKKCPGIKKMNFVWMVPVAGWLLLWLLNFGYLLSVLLYPRNETYWSEICLWIHGLDDLYANWVVIWILVPMIIGIVMSLDTKNSQKNNTVISISIMNYLYLFFAFLCILNYKIIYCIALITIVVVIIVKLILEKKPFKYIVSFYNGPQKPDRVIR